MEDLVLYSRPAIIYPARSWKASKSSPIFFSLSVVALEVHRFWRQGNPTNDD